MELKRLIRQGIPFRIHKRLQRIWQKAIRRLQPKAAQPDHIRYLESPKRAYRSSLWKALGPCVAHLIPIAVSVVIITINLRHLFLGRQYPGNIASQPFNGFLLQVAAKVLEVCIVASLTNVILQVIRQELVYGRGLALGAIAGAFSFSNLGYLVSPGFWGASLSSGKRWRRTRLCTVLGLCTLLAAAVGPSAAVLLIPRSQNWTAGGARLWYTGEEQDVYPVKLPKDGFLQWIMCSASNGTDNPFCPSGGFSAISQEILKTTLTISNVDDLAKTQRVLQDQTPVDLRLRNAIKIENHVDIDSLIMKWSYRGVDCQTGAVAARLMEAIRARKLALDFATAAWNYPFSALQPSISQYKFPETTIASCQAQLPMVKTACSAAVNASVFEQVANFPVLKSDECWINELPMSIPPLHGTIPGSFKVTWMPLPSEFGPASTGMVLQTSMDVATNTSLLVGCSIGAGWSSGIVSNPKDIWMYQGIPTYGSPWIRGFEGGSYVQDPSWRTMKIDSEWLELFAPVMADRRNLTSLELMLESSGISAGLFDSGMSQEQVWNDSPDKLNRSVTIEAVLAIAFADALSREGSLAELNVDPTQPWHDWSVRDSENNDDLSNRIFNNNDPYMKPNDKALFAQQATITIVGLAFAASSYSDYLAISVLFVYILVALAHTLYLLRQKESSSSWETLTELLALAHNSPPSRTALRNTGAGIKYRQTHGRLAVIRAIASRRLDADSDDEDKDPERLALVFEEDMESPIEEENLLQDSSPENATCSSSRISQRCMSQLSRESADVIQKKVVSEMYYG